jgi:hypothetical protein
MSLVSQPTSAVLPRTGSLPGLQHVEDRTERLAWVGGFAYCSSLKGQVEGSDRLGADLRRALTTKHTLHEMMGSQAGLFSQSESKTRPSSLDWLATRMLPVAPVLSTPERNFDALPIDSMPEAVWAVSILAQALATEAPKGTADAFDRWVCTYESTYCKGCCMSIEAPHPTVHDMNANMHHPRPKASRSTRTFSPGG